MSRSGEIQLSAISRGLVAVAVGLRTIRRALSAQGPSWLKQSRLIAVAVGPIPTTV